MRRMTESVKPAVRSDKLCILFSSHNVRFLIVQDMFRVERRLDAVHARHIQDDAPQSLSVDLHGHFLPVESAAETAALYGLFLLVSEQVLIPASLDEVAAELIVEYRLGLVRLERCNDLLVGLDLSRIGQILGTRCDEVPVFLNVQLVVLVDRVLGLEAEIKGIVAVYNACGHVRERGRDDVRLQLLDLDLLVIGLDVVNGRVEIRAVLELDEAGSLQHLERAAAVGRVVRNRDGIAVLELIDRLHLVGVQVERNDEGVADVLDLVAVAVDLALEIDAVLEGFEVGLAVGEGIVRGYIIGELYELEVDALVRELLLRRCPDILVDRADNAELYGGLCVAAAGCLCGIIGSAARRAACGQSERETCGGQGKCDNSFELHLLLFWHK